MDAFYAAVEVVDNPDLQGKPVIVGGSSKRGVVSSASYEARKFGVHSAQPIVTARRLCPQGVFLPVRVARYREISGRVFSIFDRFTPLIEPLSLDEAFLDVTRSTQLFGDAERIARTIKELVRTEIGLTVSAGIGPSKFIAKIASDIQKPDGLTIVSSSEVAAFLEPLAVERLWGVGETTSRSLHSLGVRTVGDLRHLPLELLAAQFGKSGILLHRLSLGIDDRAVETEHEVKSIGREETYGQDIHSIEAANKELLRLSYALARRLRCEAFSGKTITLKVKYHDFSLTSRSFTLPHSTDDGKEIFEICSRLLQKTSAGKKPVRLFGISVSHLLRGEHHRQRSLFDVVPVSDKRAKLNAALDAIQERFGEASILPGSLLDR
jgi:DNA polymerase-4